MTPPFEEAERYLRLARRDLAAYAALCESAAVDPAIACFHAQQAAQKAIKAVMCVHGLEFRRTHDLEELAGLLLDVRIVMPVDFSGLRRLTPYAVEFRYDDAALHLMTREEAGQIASSLIDWAAAQIANGVLPQPFPKQ
jgi:HEPN domain-containing protein